MKATLANPNGILMHTTYTCHDHGQDCHEDQKGQCWQKTLQKPLDNRAFVDLSMACTGRMLVVTPGVIAIALRTAANGPERDEALKPNVLVVDATV